MKPFSDFIKKLPAARRIKIEASARSKVAAVRLQQAREQVGVTQEELAERLHMSQPALSRFERRPNITMSVLQRYVEALGGTLEVNVLLPREAKGAKVSPKQGRSAKVSPKLIRRASRRAPARRIALVTA